MISRQEAQAQGLTHYFTGKPCLREHLSERFVSTMTCCMCHTERSQTPENKERKAAANAAWAKANPERRKATAAAWDTANKERKKATNAAWVKANSARQAAANAAWAKANPERRAAKAAQRRAAKLKATPSWADRQTINAIYEQANFMSKMCGEPFHVDHQYPLQSDWVCGLHVIENLQILTASENCSKGNRAT